ncbi:Prevent-host-death protein [Planktothrix serta PCC 8927]|uniref:Antitoxin n=1 Tax=Planktothrix serta PCC 8927 TaxID=671068 RepID=A0A7Z9DY66_9CYAN|nr:type II toxin-antitoxin system Phd/YefM family antitoxin [Planktothrix serta]VXD17625.1 Prevent-host-death protein [Planktothrix serta PCC 8927]
MSIQDTYTYNYAHTHLDQLCDQVLDNQEVVVINYSSKGKVALIPASELESLRETVYLLGSANNATRLFAALEKANSNTLKPQTISELREELGFYD